MKYFLLFFLLGAVIAYCVWEQLKPVAKVKSKILMQKSKEDTGVKWHDSLYKYLPSGIDTSILVSDSKGQVLKFSEYVKLVFNHEAIIFRDKQVWRLHRLTEESQDSLQKDDYAVASRERWDAWRYPDTVTSWKVKLADVANTLAQADYILVLKAKHKMILTRKGKTIKTFNIDMGFNPTGNKVKDGDGKTPEGIYNVDNKYFRGDKFYKSFLISYPNANDKLIAKQRGVKVGYGVSIHGTTPARVDAKDWTAGCIALQNNDIDTLFKYIASGTVIEIRK